MASNKVGGAISLEVRHERWPLKEAFTISRGSKTAADVIVVTVSDGVHTGRGEAVPYARYGETIESAIAALGAIQNVTGRHALQSQLPAGAARNAADCALLDLEAKQQAISAASIVGNAPLRPVLTAFTISLDTAETMARKALAAGALPLLKLKLGGAGDEERMAAVRHARPDARIIVDANEGWTLAALPSLFEAAAAARVELIEQPLPEHADEALAQVHRIVPVCADESLHTAADLQRLICRYDAINIKLDKTGGLTDALTLKREAVRLGFKIMVGSMVATSLAVAPAIILGQDADWVDLDGPLLLARDRDHGLDITAGIIAPPTAQLWG